MVLLPALVEAGILVSWHPSVPVAMAEADGMRGSLWPVFPRVSCVLGKGRCCTRRHYILSRNFDTLEGDRTGRQLSLKGERRKEEVSLEYGGGRASWRGWLSGA